MSKTEGGASFPERAENSNDNGKRNQATRGKGSNKGTTSSRPAGNRSGSGRSSFGNEEKPQRRSDKKKFSPSDKKREAQQAQRPAKRRSQEDAGQEGREERGERKPYGQQDRERRTARKFEDGERRSDRRDGAGKPSFRKNDRTRGDKKPFEQKQGRRPGFDKKRRREEDDADRGTTFSKGLEDAPRRRRIYKDDEGPEEKEINGPMTLNKYIAHSGQCSRRDAAEFVKQGKVRVNGELILEPGYRVQPGDEVTLSGKKMTPQKDMVYILLNKPKGFITTTEDPEERKTVMDLVANSGVERLYPVGRLDRNTTGLLLITNDGSLAHKLSHPSYNIRKVYQVTLDKNLTRADYEKISKGLELEDGKIQVDEIAYLDNRKEVGLEIHSGKNRIVRRIFESLGYVVEKLDRVMYAGLTKKNLPRGKWRFLDEKEIILLKHFKG